MPAKITINIQTWVDNGSSTPPSDASSYCALMPYSLDANAVTPGIQITDYFPATTGDATTNQVGFDADSGGSVIWFQDKTQGGRNGVPVEITLAYCGVNLGQTSRIVPLGAGIVFQEDRGGNSPNPDTNGSRNFNQISIPDANASVITFTAKCQDKGHANVPPSQKTAPSWKFYIQIADQYNGGHWSWVDPEVENSDDN